MKAPATYAHWLKFNPANLYIRELVYSFMCRLDISVNYIIKDTSYQFAVYIQYT